MDRIGTPLPFSFIPANGLNQNDFAPIPFENAPSTPPQPIRGDPETCPDSLGSVSSLTNVFENTFSVDNRPSNPTRDIIGSSRKRSDSESKETDNPDLPDSDGSSNEPSGKRRLIN